MIVEYEVFMYGDTRRVLIGLTEEEVAEVNRGGEVSHVVEHGRTRLVIRKVEGDERAGTVAD